MTEYKKEEPQRKETTDETIEAYLSDLLFGISLLEKSDKYDGHPTFLKTMRDVVRKAWDLVAVEYPEKCPIPEYNCYLRVEE